MTFKQNYAEITDLIKDDLYQVENDLTDFYCGSNDLQESLLDILKMKYKNSYKCVLKIEEYIKKNFNYEISNDEKLYLMVHIERTVYKTDK